MENDSTRQKIIEATIQCIGIHGIHEVTNRLIAKSANVNCAAINYHFGSKENLINEAVKRSLDNYLSEFFNASFEEDPATNPQFILKRFLAESLKDALSSPQITKSYLYESLIHGDYSGIFIEKLNDFLKRLHDYTDTYISEKDSEKAKLSMIQMISSIMFIGLMPDFFQGFLAVDFKEPEIQKEFVDILINHYCNAGLDKRT
jgi:AcrR family transcriptional regulator